MSKIKSKVVKWKYVTEPFDVRVINPLKNIKRTHAPLMSSLSSDSGILFLHLRPCVQGDDEYGAVVKYLYCTRDGRFFTRGKDGWNEVIPANHSTLRTNKAVGGSAGCPQLRHFGDKYCHRCVAFAWLPVPRDVQLQMVGVDAPTKWEVDHLNTDHKNWTADNLQWVTADENRRRGAIAKLMRKTGLNPKLLTPTLCRGIYTLPMERIDEFIERYQMCCEADDGDLSVENIRVNVAIALDAMK